MRFYLLCESIDAGGAPYILAEVVREAGVDRALSIASALAGARTRILTRNELRGSIAGRSALERWDDRNDGTFERETRLLNETSRGSGRGRMRVVDADELPDRPRVSRHFSKVQNVSKLAPQRHEQPVTAGDDT